MATSVLRPTSAPDFGAGDQRRRIIDAMIDSCAEKTYAATTITDIVARARISRTTFYKQFDDKRACFDAAIGHCIEQLQAVAASAHDRDEAPGRRGAQGDERRDRGAGRAPRPGAAPHRRRDRRRSAGDRVLPQGDDPGTGRALVRGEGSAEAHSDPRLAFGKAQVLILNQIAIGQADRLPELLPEIVYLAVSPFGGHEAALHQSQLAGESTTSHVAPSER